MNFSLAEQPGGPEFYFRQRLQLNPTLGAVSVVVFLTVSVLLVLAERLRRIN
jgi:hypothetical protein